MSKPNSINDFVYLSMRNGQWWTFWSLQKNIQDMTGRFYGEPSLSASIRELRKHPSRVKYGLPLNGDIVIKKRITEGKGYQYRLITGENNV